MFRSKYLYLLECIPFINITFIKNVCSISSSVVKNRSPQRKAVRQSLREAKTKEEKYKYEVPIVCNAEGCGKLMRLTTEGYEDVADDEEAKWVSFIHLFFKTTI